MFAPRVPARGSCRALIRVAAPIGKCVCFCISLGLILPLTSSIGAGAIRVPADEPTIQAGIDAAATGDTVLVAPGTYTGAGNRDINFNGKDIVLISEAGAVTTIIDCQGSASNNARGFIFENGEPFTAVVAGFTIRNGYRSGTTWPFGFGGGMIIEERDTNPTIQDCIFESNHAEKAGGGLATANEALPVIRDCVFSQNTSGGGGGGAFVSASASFLDCHFLNNDGGLGFGGGMECYSSNEPVVRDCEFRENSARGGGGLATSYADPLVVQCDFVKNTATTHSGGAVRAALGAHLAMTFCIFIDNAVEDSRDGGTVAASDAAIDISQSTFYQNVASYGTGVFAKDGASIDVERTILSWGVDGNAAACDDGASTITLTCCDVFANEGGDWVGCIEEQAGDEGNMSADPLFCKISEGDFQLAGNSPCAEGFTGTCGTIGRFDVACPPSAVQPATWGGIKALYRR